MNDIAGPETVGAPGASRARPGYAIVLWIALPLVLLGLAASWLVLSDPLRAFNNGAPPVERLTFERRILDNTGIHLLVRAGGSEPMTIAQVQVDDAYWTFTQAPPGDLPRLATAWIHVPFPWTLGDAHVVRVVTKTGTTFDHEVPVAVRTPEFQSSQLVPQAMLGAFVGIVPVAIGLMFYPALRGVGSQGMGFLLALTIGLLAFLFADSLEDALELAGEAAAAFQGPVMVVLAALISFLLLWVIGRRRGAPTGLALATYIAIGIGLHNLGEGLAIGAAFAAGAAGLGIFLVLGFTLHNVTEGIGIAVPLVKEPPPLSAFVGLALLAGAPAILGMWLGSLAYSPLWAALALAIGAGAILQVIVEVGAYLYRLDDRWKSGSVPVTAIGGLVAGLSLMYATAVLVKV
ncbi:metal transporter [Microvirga sp. VF16]|uniref:metal transporter n=1 Tax=Microvirga sp. VF16 TaxID=2807101 RepID=UPI00193DD760|nr:metal transporter [Microvirga sp. VF16]QRM31608.1 metal transporter [Microvirga sp. VF16]